MSDDQPSHPLEAKCPHCGASNEVDADNRGLPIPCRECLHQFVPTHAGQSEWPPWLLTVFNNVIIYADEILRVLDMCTTGLKKLKAGLPLAEAVADYKASRKGDTDSDALRAARQRAAFAEVEIRNDFPLLHAHTLVGLWGSLEVMIEDLVVAWLANKPACLKDSALSKIKLPVGAIESLSTEQRMRLVLEQWKRREGSCHRAGINRFESCLEAIGLTGPVDDDVKRNVFEAQQVRNLVVHRSSVVDTRFVESCPWMGLSLGDQLAIGAGQFSRYAAALTCYSTCVIDRARAKLRIERKKASDCGTSPCR